MLITQSSTGIYHSRYTLKDCSMYWADVEAYQMKHLLSPDIYSILKQEISDKAYIRVWKHYKKQTKEVEK